MITKKTKRGEGDVITIFNIIDTGICHSIKKKENRLLNVPYRNKFLILQGVHRINLSSLYIRRIFGTLKMKISTTIQKYKTV